jgi:hypothetical protein
VSSDLLMWGRNNVVPDHVIVCYLVGEGWDWADEIGGNDESSNLPIGILIFSI